MGEVSSPKSSVAARLGVGCAIGVCVGHVAIATSMALQAPMQRCMGPRRQAAVRVEAKKPTVHQRIADKNKTKSGSSSGTRINPDRLCNERDYKPARQAFNVALHRAPTGVAMHMHMRRCWHRVHDAEYTPCASCLAKPSHVLCACVLGGHNHPSQAACMFATQKDSLVSLPAIYCSCHVR